MRYNLTDLQKVKIAKGNIEGFQSTWIMVLSGMRKQPEEDILELLYYERVEAFQGIAEDIAHYNRLHEGSGGDRSYAFLFDAVQRYLQRTRQRAVREAISQSLGEVGKPAAPGAWGDKGSVSRGKEKGDGAKEKGKGNEPPFAICRYYAEGKCLKGDKCTYKHIAATPKGGKDGGKKGEGKGKHKDRKPERKRSRSVTPGGRGRTSEK